MIAYEFPFRKMMKILFKLRIGILKRVFTICMGLIRAWNEYLPQIDRTLNCSPLQSDAYLIVQFTQWINKISYKCLPNHNVRLE